MTRSFLLSSALSLVFVTCAFAGGLPPAFTWSGFYIGGQFGYQWGQSQDEVWHAANGRVAGLPGHADKGIAGGGHVGYNYQINQLVFGLEGDVNNANYQGSDIGIDPLNRFYTLYERTQIGIDGSIRGRVGMAWDRVLVYGTAGLALASIDNTFSAVGPLPGTALENTENAGWTAGAGIEYAVTNNWSLRAEYRYSDYGRVSYSLTAIPPHRGGTNTKVVTDNLANVGFSYKFDDFAPPAPVDAKY